MGIKWIGFGVLMTASAVFLSSCVSQLQAASLTPEEVMQNLSSSLSSLESFSYDLDLTLSGQIDNGLGLPVHSANLRMHGEIDARDMTDLKSNNYGEITAFLQGTPLTIAGQVKELNNITYFKINDINLSGLISVNESYLGEWYKIQHSQHQNSFYLGSKSSSDIQTNLSQKIMEEIANRPLFEVIAVLPDETIGSTRSHHYQAKLDTNLLEDILAEIESELDTNSMDFDISQLSDYAVDIWVDKRNFALTKISLRGILNGADPLGVDLSIVLGKHNEDFEFVAPSQTQENNGDYLSDSFPLSF